jgi:hypothetical protein
MTPQDIAGSKYKQMANEPLARCKHWCCQASPPGYDLHAGLLGVVQKNLLVVPHSLSDYDHYVSPFGLTVVKWVVWIRPISDGRSDFRDFLDQDL